MVAIINRVDSTMAAAKAQARLFSTARMLDLPARGYTEALAVLLDAFTRGLVTTGEHASLLNLLTASADKFNAQPKWKKIGTYECLKQVIAQLNNLHTQ